jgi:hypothetical protein
VRPAVAAGVRRRTGDTRCRRRLGPRRSGDDAESARGLGGRSPTYVLDRDQVRDDRNRWRHRSHWSPAADPSGGLAGPEWSVSLTISGSPCVGAADSRPALKSARRDRDNRSLDRPAPDHDYTRERLHLRLADLGAPAFQLLRSSRTLSSARGSTATTRYWTATSASPCCACSSSGAQQQGLDCHYAG